MYNTLSHTPPLTTTGKDIAQIHHHRASALTYNHMHPNTFLLLAEHTLTTSLLLLQRLLVSVLGQGEAALAQLCF